MITQIREWLREQRKPPPLPKLRRFEVTCENYSAQVLDAHFSEEYSGVVKFWRYPDDKSYPRIVAQYKHWRSWREITQEVEV